MVRIVVPREEIVAHAAGVFDRTEPIGKIWPVLERPELGFGKWIVGAHAGPRVTGADAEVREQLGHQLAAHRRAAVGMDRELVRADPLLEARGFDQALGQTGVLVRRDHPAHDVTAEQIEDHIQRVIQVRDRPLQLGEVPGPDLIGRRRHELRFGIRRMPRLGAPLPDFIGPGQEAIHRAR
jgi:hypothetical protein